MDKAQLRGRANKSRLQNMFEAMIQNRIQMVVRIETRLGQKNMVDSPDLAKIKDTLSSTKSGLEQLSKNVGQSTSTDPKVLKEEAQEQLGKFHGYSSMIIQGQGLILVATGKTIVTRVETALAKIEETSTNNPLPAETQTKIKTLKTDLNSLSESIDSAEKKITGITPAKNKEEAKNNLENTKTIIKNLRTEIAGIKDQLGLLIPELKTFIQTNKKTTKPVTGQEPSKTLPVNNPEESVAPTLEP
jgi:septal ring factor EnvC (AmiA/AmiB activator)